MTVTTDLHLWLLGAIFAAQVAQLGFQARLLERLTTVEAKVAHHREKLKE